MNKNLKHELTTIFLYSLGVYLVLLPLELYITAISISVVIGFFFGFLNHIITILTKIYEKMEKP